MLYSAFPKTTFNFTENDFILQYRMRKIIAISLAILTLALSLKMDISYHFCGDKLVQTKILFGQSKASCGMEDNDESCENNSNSSTIKAACCQNQLQQISTDDYQQTEIHFQILSACIPTCSQNNYLKAVTENKTIKSFYYHPPPGYSSVSLANIQNFLI